MTEAALQRYIAEHCKYRRLIYWKLAITGRRGVCDLMILGPGGKILFLEIKRPDGKGTPSAMQKLIIERLREFGFEAYIVEGLSIAKDLIDAHFLPKTNTQ